VTSYNSLGVVGENMLMYNFFEKEEKKKKKRERTESV
jgi:hypothetical protein